MKFDVKMLRILQIIGSLYAVCNQMCQANTEVHQTRDKNSISYEAEPENYTGPIGVLA